jgi:hypothetical protein
MTQDDKLVIEQEEAPRIGASARSSDGRSWL